MEVMQICGTVEVRVWVSHVTRRNEVSNISHFSTVDNIQFGILMVQDVLHGSEVLRFHRKTDDRTSELTFPQVSHS
jgi:hypothetical protein